MLIKSYYATQTVDCTLMVIGNSPTRVQTIQNQGIEIDLAVFTAQITYPEINLPIFSLLGKSDYPIP